MSKPFAAYTGSRPYVFVCYAHSDSKTVYADLKTLHDEGINLWYDEGIQAGSVWRAEIASSIKGAHRFIFYISEASLQSAHCLREVDYALSHDIEVIPVYLDDSTLPDELALVFSRVQALYREEDQRYMQHLQTALRKGLSRIAPKQLPGKRGPGVILGVLGIVALAVVVLVWMGREDTDDPGQADVTETASPTAFGLYSEGQELMQRWDKGDNLESAIRLFGEASELDPGFALAFARLAEAQRIRYALTRDEDWLEEAAANAHEAERLNPGLAPVQVALGRVYATQGKHDLAFVATERAVSIDPNDASANQAMSRIYESQGRFDDAENSILKAVALAPDDIMILDGFANFLFYQGRYDEAVVQWEKVIGMAPDHYAALVNLGSALDESGRTAEAITIYERAIEIKPTYMGYSNLGAANFEEDRYEEAVAAFHKALEIDDTDWLAWGNLASVYFRVNGMDTQARETFDKAIVLAEAARQQNSRDPYIYSDLSLYYAQIDQPELAVQRLKTAITLAPDSVEILVASAKAYARIGQREPAIELINKALTLGYTRAKLEQSRSLGELSEDPGIQYPE